MNTDRTLDFILGKAYHNVSDELRKRIVNDVSNGKNAIIIIPDQFNFETEKELFRAFKKAGRTICFPAVSVCTFSKLSDRIIEEYDQKKNVAGDITKNIVMYRAVADITSNSSDNSSLKIYGRIASKPGFAVKMTKTIAMLKASGISAKDLNGKLSNSVSLSSIKEDFRTENPVLFKKLEDISTIYSAYETRMNKLELTDKLDKTMTAASLAAKNSFFKGTNVYIDGFNDFSLSQINFIESILSHAASVTMAFTTDISENHRDIFTTINSTIAHFTEYASSNAGMKVTLPNNSFTDKTRTSPSIIRISDELYLTNTVISDNKCKLSDITLIRADDIHNEMDYVAAEIRRLTVLCKNGLKYKDIAVLSASPTEYRSSIESSFSKYEIPLFCDIPESILHKPLTNMVLSLLNVLSSFTIENVLNYLKTGFVLKSDKKTITLREIYELENYIYTWDISDPDNLLKTFCNEGVENIQEHPSELIRADIIVPLKELCDKVKGKTGSEITELICDYLYEKIDINSAVKYHCTSAENMNGYQSLWNKILEIFNTLHDSLDEKITMSDYYHLVRDICSSTSMSAPPAVNDAVLAGDIRRTRVNKVKVVFIVGATYDSFPSTDESMGIFSEHELELLSESSLKLAMNRIERYHYDKYMAYRTISLPSQKLYISYPMLSSSCDPNDPSDIITSLSKHYSLDIISSSPDNMGDNFYCTTKRAAQQQFARRYHSISTERETLKKALIESGCRDFVKKLDTLSHKRKHAFQHKLDTDTARKMFRQRTFSATNVEKLSMCRFRYFCDKGLRISEPIKKNFSKMEVGNIVHYALQKILEYHRDKLDIFIGLTRTQLINIADTELANYQKEKFPANITHSKRFDYLFNNLTTVIADVLTVLQVEFSSRDYRPVFFELKISDGSQQTTIPTAAFISALDVSKLAPMSVNSTQNTTATAIQIPSFGTNQPGSTITSINTSPLVINIDPSFEVYVTGEVDRVDIFRDADGKEYIRVVDYKTGKREFTMVNACYGISAQMLLYLHTLCTDNLNLNPGGVYYLPSMVAKPISKGSTALQVLMNERGQTGLFISDPATDEEIEKYKNSLLSIAEAQNCKLKSEAENLIPKEKLTKTQYDNFIRLCLKNIKETITKLYSGDVYSVPTLYNENKKEKNPCSYCSYNTICGHIPDYNIHATANDELLELLETQEDQPNMFDHTNDNEITKTEVKTNELE